MVSFPAVQPHGFLSASHSFTSVHLEPPGCSFRSRMSRQSDSQSLHGMTQQRLAHKGVARTGQARLTTLD
eukprot:3772891-Lingulodinium_polyedra.AAC.1